jgi:hypothetical protein
MRKLTAGFFILATFSPVAMYSENEIEQLQAGAGLISMSVSPTTLTGGTTATAVINLRRGSAASRVIIHLSSSNEAVVTVPAQVAIMPRQSSATFAVTTRPTSVATAVTIAASLSIHTITSKITVAPPVLAAISFNQSSVTAPGSVTGTISLTGIAPAKGVVVSLSTDRTAATVPASIQVASGSAQQIFTVTTKPVATATNVTISASSGAVTKSAQLAVTPSAAATSGGTASASAAVKGFGNCMTRANFDALVSGGTAFSSLAAAATTQGTCYACHSTGTGGAFLSQNANDMYAYNRLSPYVLKLAVPTQKSDGTYTLVASKRFRDHGSDSSSHPRYILSSARQAAIDQYFSRTLARFLANTNGCRSNPAN